MDEWTILPINPSPIFYVLFIEKRDLKWLGFTTQRLKYSLSLGVIVFVFLFIIYYPIFLYYLPYILVEKDFSLYIFLIDII